jgi:hypothetical protein
MSVNSISDNVVFGKQGTDAIELSAIAAGKGGFIIKGESASFWSDHLASNAGDINGDGLDDLIIYIALFITYN